MKPGPLLAMLILTVLAVWMVVSPTVTGRSGERTPGSTIKFVQVNARKIWFERVPPQVAAPLVAEDRALREAVESGESLYRYLSSARDLPEGYLTSSVFFRSLGGTVETSQGRNWLFEALNITSWGNFWWVALGFAGQAAFFGRMLFQWVASEKREESVVPTSFWWLSLLGGAALLSYFIWRRDIVGVLGQCTGVVIYARNLSLIYRRHPHHEGPGSSAPAQTHSPA